MKNTWKTAWSLERHLQYACSNITYRVTTCIKPFRQHSAYLLYGAHSDIHSKRGKLIATAWRRLWENRADVPHKHYFLACMQIVYGSQTTKISVKIGHASLYARTPESTSFFMLYFANPPPPPLATGKHTFCIMSTNWGNRCTNTGMACTGQSYCSQVKSSVYTWWHIIYPPVLRNNWRWW